MDIQRIFRLVGILFISGTLASTGMKSDAQLQLLVQNDNDLILDEEALTSLLLNDEVKNLPVCVISIAGAIRTGKSFMLNIILTYFKKKGWKTPNGEWLKNEDNLKNDIAWRGGTTGHTQGIIAWGEPIIVEKKNGLKVAIILLDTQGDFDNRGSKHKNARVFGLSNLFSSLQVFNVMRQIQSNDLEHLQTFVEFSKMPMFGENPNVDENTSFYFQDLLFLVRDWVHISNHQHGSDGGDYYMKELQADIGKSTTEDDSVIQYLQKAFAKIGCYLMPIPGEKVLYCSQEDKSLNVSDLGDRFRSHVIQFIEKYMDPEKLTKKTIANLGETTCEVLYSYVIACSKTLLSGNGPIMMSEMKTIAENTNKICRDEKLVWYKETVEKVIKSIESWDEFDNILKNKKQQAGSEMLKILWFGNSNPQKIVDDILDTFKEVDVRAIVAMREKREKILFSELKEWKKSSISTMKKVGYFASLTYVKKMFAECSQEPITLDERDSDFITKQLNTAKKIIRESYNAAIRKLHDRNCKWEKGGAIVGSAIVGGVAGPVVGSGVGLLLLTKYLIYGCSELESESYNGIESRKSQ